MGVRRLLLLLIFSQSFNVHGQLSGTYTVGGINPDYATFQDVYYALDNFGVSGPVVFNVRSGTYGPFYLGDYVGASAVNTVTIQSEALNADSVVILDTMWYDAVHINDGSGIVLSKMTVIGGIRIL